MGQGKSVASDKSETIETSNYGLFNLSEDNLGTMGLVEIILILLLIIAVVMTWIYCVKKQKQRNELGHARWTEYSILQTSFNAYADGSV